MEMSKVMAAMELFVKKTNEFNGVKEKEFEETKERVHKYFEEYTDVVEATIADMLEEEFDVMLTLAKHNSNVSPADMMLLVAARSKMVSKGKCEEDCTERSSDTSESGSIVSLLKLLDIL